MRLGELEWELERESFIDRKAGEARPIQRGSAPEPNFGPSRDSSGRVLRDYPWFAEYDSALYVDGFLASEQGKHRGGARALRVDHAGTRGRASNSDATCSRPRLPATCKYDYPGALAEYNAVLKYPD